MAAKTIALVGANGFVGKAFVNGILNQDLDCRILARAESIESAPLKEFESRGASLHAISYDDESSILKALQGVDVLVSTVAAAAIPVQVSLIKAAKAAGVKLFFPSEYGGVYGDPAHNISPFLQLKTSIINTAREVGLPYAVLSTGGFPELCFPYAPFGWNFAEKKVDVWGDGSAKITWTALSSAADWIANVLKTVPIERLQNKHLRIQGSAASVNEIIKLWEQKHNSKLSVEYHPTKELDEKLSADKNDIFALILREWSLGHAEIGGVDNDLYPGWQPGPIENAL